MLLADYLRSAGTSLEDLLHAADIDSAHFADTDFALDTQQYERLLSAAMRTTGRSDLGFEWGRRIRQNSHGILGYALLSYATLDQGLRQCARYFRLLTPMFRMTYQRTGDHMEIVYRPAQAMGPQTLNMLMELMVVATHVQCTPLLHNPSSVYDIYLSMEEPPHSERYRELAPARVHFRASSLPEARLVANTWSLDARLPMANEHAVRMAEERCEALLRQTGEQVGWTEWVLMMLNEAEEDQPTLDELARFLGVSPRTLDRNLKKEGSSLRDLSVDVRNGKARRLLLEQTLPISQIAYQLGFTDVANFSRAFRRAHGVSPSDYRRSDGAAQ
ncbi:helix-turn-helix domain-containing protein [Paraburkholderia pallida]|uniref:helix-turn-helix domain-containing protein n=1 Tax=Paraburkholderia pallida TaxID=2547399 RepID=UPI001E33BE57|nr:AraC family transcriptional regulator [Paraburkholderia pallida]